jgi:hypothetical protein
MLAGVLTLTPLSQGGRTAVGPSLEVTFSSDGTVSVTLPDGTSVGSTSGAPTLISAGFYTVLVSGPEGCTQVGYFELQGPGVNIDSNLDNGEVANATYNAHLLPDSMYTWRTIATPAVYTFMTSNAVEGTPPSPAAAGSSSTSASASPIAPTQTLVGGDIVGSAATPATFRGTLKATVSATNMLSLTFKGKPVARLTAGSYTITVNNKSPRSRVILQETHQPAITITSLGFLGTRSLSLDLTPGQWFLTSTPVRTQASFVVTA